MSKVARDKKGTHSLQAIIALINRDCEEKLIEKILNDEIADLALVRKNNISFKWLIDLAIS